MNTTQMKVGDAVYEPMVQVLGNDVYPRIVTREVYTFNPNTMEIEVSDNVPWVSSWVGEGTKWVALEDIFVDKKDAKNAALEKAKDKINSMFDARVRNCMDQINDLEHMIEEYKLKKQTKLMELDNYDY